MWRGATAKFNQPSGCQHVGLSSVACDSQQTFALFDDACDKRPVLCFPAVYFPGAILAVDNDLRLPGAHAQVENGAGECLRGALVVIGPDGGQLTGVGKQPELSICENRASDRGHLVRTYR